MEELVQCGGCRELVDWGGGLIGTRLSKEGL